MSDQPKYNNQNQPAAAESVLCSSLQDLLFTDFVKCCCDLDYSPLTRAGHPSRDEMIIAWVPLISEFYVTTEFTEGELYVPFFGEIISLNTKIIHISCLTQVLKMSFSNKLITELRKWGYNYPLNYETYKRDLITIRNDLVKDDCKLSGAIKRYNDDRQQKKDSGELAAIKEHYTNAICIIETFLNKELDLKTLTTFEFANLYAQYVITDSKTNDKS